MWLMFLLDAVVLKTVMTSELSSDDEMSVLTRTFEYHDWSRCLEKYRFDADFDVDVRDGDGVCAFDETSIGDTTDNEDKR